MKDDITLIMYSHSTYSDVWPIFFKQSSKYLKNYKKVLFLTLFVTLLVLRGLFARGDRPSFGARAALPVRWRRLALVALGIVAALAASPPLLPAPPVRRHPPPSPHRWRRCCRSCYACHPRRRSRCRLRRRHRSPSNGEQWRIHLTPFLALSPIVCVPKCVS